MIHKNKFKLLDLINNTKSFEKVGHWTHAPILYTTALITQLFITAALCSK